MRYNKRLRNLKAPLTYKKLKREVIKTSNF